jgi:hypothetical protein
MSFTERRIDILIDCYTDLVKHNKSLIGDEFYGDVALGKFKAYESMLDDLIRLKEDLKRWEDLK